MIEHFSAAAGVDPVSAAILAAGGVLLIVAFGVMGWLTTGGVFAGLRDIVG